MGPVPTVFGAGRVVYRGRSVYWSLAQSFSFFREVKNLFCAVKTARSARAFGWIGSKSFQNRILAKHWKDLFCLLQRGKALPHFKARNYFLRAFFVCVWVGAGRIGFFKRRLKRY